MAEEPRTPTPYELHHGDHIPQGIDSARRSLISNGTFVLFVDVLGFGRLVEEHEEKYVEWTATLSPIVASMRPPPESQLQVMFRQYHEALERTLREAARFRPPAIVFSDSAFISHRHPQLLQAVNFARQLMRNMILAGVPTRMGLAFGGFSASRFSTDTTVGRTHHVSEFYGTAVVRAHNAESCGVKSIGIFVHPSAFDRIAESRAEPRPLHVFSGDVPPKHTIGLPSAAPRHCVTHELNYLEARADYELLRDKIVEMRTRSSASFSAYYDNALSSLEGMRDALR